MAQKTKPVIVTVDDGRLKEIQDVAAELGAKGMQVERVMAMTGVIAGRAPAAKMAALRKVKGVLSVEEEQIAGLSSTTG